MTSQPPAPARGRFWCRLRRARGREGPDAGYAPFGVSTEPEVFGLRTSVVETAAGRVTVRHGRPSGRPGAPALILLHGAAGSWSTFTPFLAAAAQVGAELPDLVIPDLPGWGESALPNDAAGRTIERVSAAVAAVARALGYEQWILVGHSLGGFVALELASAEPASTRGVVLVSPTTFGVADAVRHPLRGLRSLPAYVGMLAVMRVLATVRTAGTRLVTAFGTRRFFRLAMSPLFADAACIDGSVYLALAAEARPLSFAIASGRAGLYDTQRWAGIRCPVRSLHGSADVFVAESDDERLGATIADFEGGVMDGAGHFGHIERPFEVLDLLLRTASDGKARGCVQGRDAREHEAPDWHACPGARPGEQL